MSVFSSAPLDATNDAGSAVVSMCPQTHDAAAGHLTGRGRLMRFDDVLMIWFVIAAIAVAVLAP